MTVLTDESRGDVDSRGDRYKTPELLKVSKEEGKR